MVEGFVLDYEAAMWEAVKLVFQGASIHGCVFLLVSSSLAESASTYDLIPNVSVIFGNKGTKLVNKI